MVSSIPLPAPVPAVGDADAAGVPGDTVFVLALPPAESRSLDPI